MKPSKPLQLILETSIKRSEKKVINPTRSLMLAILDEAGLEGAWQLKDPHRIKKKGRERFGVTRIESRAGSQSIRLWCKPSGNDTAFEYSLCMPAGEDIQAAFNVLKRVNPISLRIPESPMLPVAVMARVVYDAPPIPETHREKVVEMTESAQQSVREVADGLDEMTLVAEYLKASPGASDDEVEKHVLSACGREVPRSLITSTRTAVSSKSDAGQEVHKSPAEAKRVYESMELDFDCLLSDQHAMDRAIMAIGFVAENGYAKKTDASTSIIRNLGIKRFVSGGSKTYTSVEGAMRALMMALRKKGRYIERIRCEPQRGRGVSDGIRAYRLTPLGTKRIEAIKGKFGTEAESRLNPAGKESSPTTEEKQQLAKSPGASGGEIAAVVSSGAFGRLKDLVASYEEAEKQVAEIEILLGSLEEDISNMRLDMEGLNLAEKEKMKQMDTLQVEIEKIRSRKGEISGKIQKKESEKREWETDRNPHLAERTRIGSILDALEGKK